jgi:hypothetical protein
MKAVARLLLTSFTATETLAVAGAGGVGALFLGVLACLLIKLPVPTVFSLQALGFAALGAVFFGSMFMPSMFSRLAQSNTIDLLPQGRLKLLASTLLTILIVSLHVPVAFIAIMRTTAPDGMQDIVYYSSGLSMFDYLQAPFFWFVFAIAVLAYTWGYIVMWSAAAIHTRSIGAFSRTMLLLAMPILLVAKYHKASIHFTLDVIVILNAALWSSYALCYLVLARLKIVNDMRHRVVAVLKDFRWRQSATQGNEMRLILGLHHPWLYTILVGVYALGLISSAKLHSGWLFYLTLFGMMTGGLPATIAANARGLWLRKPWSREQLFANVESFLLRNASTKVLLLAIWGALIAMHAQFSWPLIVLGSLHLAVTAFASIYLGLMQTGRMRWSNAILIVFTFGVAVTGAVASSGDLIGVPIMTALLAVLTLAYRSIAKRRWTHLDWIVCRPGFTTGTYSL